MEKKECKIYKNRKTLNGDVGLRTVIIVQARMGSTRFPGKVLKEILGKPLLGYLIERLKAVKAADDFIIATTTNPIDDVIVEYCLKQNVKVFRGSEEDVFARYLESGKYIDAYTVVRITADCPIIDPLIVDQFIAYYYKHKPKLDYLTNALMRTFPYGMEVEVFSMEKMIQASKSQLTPDEREHVTPVFYLHPQKYVILNVENPINLSHYRLTVDTPEDFALVKLIVEALYPKDPLFSLDQIIVLLKEHPEWLKLNANVRQKTLKSLEKSHGKS